jgi:general secretion pathway protein I
MVALLIVAFALAAMSTTVVRAIGDASAMRDRTYASWIAQNKIVELRASGVVPKTGSTNGEVEYANSEWAWRATVNETGVDSLLRVDVEISRPGEELPIRTVTGFIGEPVQPGSANRAWLGSSSRRPGNENNDDDAGAEN